MVHIKIKTDNAAFTDDPGREVGRILHKLAEQFEAEHYEPGDLAPLMDYNGNSVGTVKVTR